MEKILLKGIFIEHLLIKNTVEDIQLPEIILETDTAFWEELEMNEKQPLNISHEQSEMACWSCSLFFDEKPWGIPIFSSNEIIIAENKYEFHNNLLDSTSRTEKNNMKFMGNFCSVCCAVRFLEESSEIPEHCKQNYKNLLYHLYEQYIGKKVAFIPLAYPKYKMRIYCGKDGWSEQEFKEKNRQLEKQYVV